MKTAYFKKQDGSYIRKEYDENLIKKEHIASIDNLTIVTEEDYNTYTQSESEKVAISIYVFPLPVVEQLAKSEEYQFDQELSDLLDRLSVRGGRVKTDPTSLTVTAELYDTVATLLPQSTRDKIANYKQ